MYVNIRFVCGAVNSPPAQSPIVKFSARQVQTFYFTAPKTILESYNLFCLAYIRHNAVK